MAERELTYKILTTAETAGLDKVEAGLTDLDRAGTKAMGGLEDAARSVDTSLDRVGKSSRDNLGKVDDEADKARQGMTDLKEESADTAREAAASFQDVTSALDAVQEIAANALVGFGPAGAAAGILAASGIGLLFNQLENAAQKANDLKERIIGLAGAVRDVGGDLGAVDFSSSLIEFGDTVVQAATALNVLGNGVDGVKTNFDLIQAAAAQAGISVEAFMAGMKGNDAQATAAALDMLNQALADNEQAVNGANLANLQALATGDQNAFTTQQNTTHTRDQSTALEYLKQTFLDYTGIVDTATASGIAQAEALRVQTQAQKDLASAVDGFTDPATTYTQLLADKQAAEQASATATAAATKSTKDSWTDYAKPVKVGVREYIEELEKQVEAQEKWATNLGKLAKRGVDEGVLAELSKMGPEGAPLIAKLTTASDAELAKMVDLFHRQGAAASTAAGEGITSQVPRVRTAAAKAHEAAEGALSKPVTVRVDVAPPSHSELAAARAAAESWFVFHPVRAKVTPGPWSPSRIIP